MIRQAQRSDIRTLADLWARSFSGQLTVEQRVASLENGGVYGGIETAWLAEQAGRAVGAFRGYALSQQMHGATWPMMGLAAVAVDETARRRGVGRELCRHAVRIGRERGDVLSILYPFRPAFYEALGWGSVGALHAVRFRPEALRAGGGESVRRAGPADAVGVAAVYDRFAAETNGPIRRTQRVWRQHLDGDGVQVFVTGDDAVRGYVIVRFGRSHAPDEKPLYIRELLADDQRTYEELLGWVAAQRDAWRVVHYEAAPDEHFAHRLTEPRPPGFHMVRNGWAPVGRVLRGPMLRLLDVKAAFAKRLRWGPAAPMSFGLHVNDGIVTENDGAFVVDYDGSRATVRRGGAGPLLRLPVAVLAQIYAGELRVRDALMLGLAEQEGDAGAVDSLLQVDRCFRLLDEF
jgi:predicted acetyltransferase